MNPFAAILAICCLASALARPSYPHGKEQLEGVPNESHFSKLSYPKFDIIPLGVAIKDSLPPAVVQINKKVIIKQPQPYPVKVPVPVPHPVEVPKPYPVIQTKIVKVPHPVPYEVIKKVPVPFEVPKPYPVPKDEFNSGSGGSFSSHAHLSSEEYKVPDVSAPVASYGGSFTGHEQFGAQDTKGVHEESQEGGGYDGGYGGGFEGSDHGGFAQADQSSSYGAQSHSEQPSGWLPSSLQSIDSAQQVEEHQH